MVEEQVEPATETAIPEEGIANEMLPKDKVTHLVRRERADAYNKGKQDAMRELQSQQPAAPQPADLAQLVNQQVQSALEAQRQEEAKRQNDLYNQQVAMKIHADVQQATSRYPDIQEVVGRLQLPEMPDVAQLAAATDNPADVLYHLGQEPSRAALLRVLPPAAAFAQVKKISDEIKRNQEAATKQQPNEPLDRVEPSSAGSLGADDYANMSISQLRKTLRGR